MLMYSRLVAMIRSTARVPCSSNCWLLCLSLRQHPRHLVTAEGVAQQHTSCSLHHVALGCIVDSSISCRTKLSLPAWTWAQDYTDMLQSSSLHLYQYLLDQG